MGTAWMWLAGWVACSLLIAFGFAGWMSAARELRRAQTPVETEEMGPVGRVSS